MADDFVKIRFDLEVDGDGYPPVGSESLNAIVLGENTFQIDNTPFFVEEIAVGDVVEAFKTSDSGDKFVFSRVLSLSQDQSLSIIFLDTSFLEGVSKKLREYGCYCEYGEFNNDNLVMLAVNVSDPSVYGDVMSLLLHLGTQDLLSVAELCIKEFEFEGRK